MSELPSVRLVKKHSSGEYYDFLGVVNVVRREDDRPTYIKILDRKNGEELCQVNWKYRNDFIPRDGRVVKFRGILDKLHSTEEHRIITPHIKRD